MRPVVLFAITIVVSAGSVKGEPKFDASRQKAIDKALETFAGTWEIMAAQPVGASRGAQRLVFRKNRTYAALDAEGKELWDGTFDLDPTATPKIWDHRSNEARKQGGDVLGIYLLEGDSLKVGCVVGKWKDKEWTGKPRPAEFKLPEADVVLELKRVKVGNADGRNSGGG